MESKSQDETDSAQFHQSTQVSSWSAFKNVCITVADPGFFLGGGALVSCSTSTPINHIVFF